MRKIKVFLEIIFIISIIIYLTIKVQADSIETENKLEVEYRSHVQDIGWQEYVGNESQSGTTGKNLKIEAMNIKLKNNTKGINIKYTTYIEGNGWQNTVSNGEQTGTTGKNLKMEAIKIWLEGSEEYSVEYRTHVQDIGWTEWVYDGAISGNLGDELKIEAIQIKIVSRKNNSDISVKYSSHVQDIGWQSEKSEYDISGTIGKNLKVESLKIKLDNAPEGVKIKYKTYVEKNGWQKWSEEGNASGSTGKNLRVLGVRIKLEGTDKYSVKYRVHVENEGWMNWVENGEIAGRISANEKIEAIQIMIVERNDTNSNKIGIEYYAYLEGNVPEEDKILKNGEKAGTTGQNRKLEAISMELINAGENANVKYMAHVQDIGWMNWVNSDEIAGILNKGLKIEAIKIKLDGLDEYTVEYRVHVQDIGWTDWYIDGESAGTTGKNLKIEAIEIKLVPHYKRYYVGVDVSRWQNKIDFNKVVKSKKVDFIIARIGWYSEDQGKFIIDNQFARNYKEAKTSGIPMGAYIYSYAKDIEGAKKEAEETIKYLKESKQTTFELPIFFDIEDETQKNIDKETMTQMAIVFCDTLKKEGYKVGIYSYSYWLSNYIDLNKLPKDYSKWVADYGSSEGQIPNDIFKFSPNYDIWQYTDKGKIDGIDGDVDMNICYKKYF